MTLENNFITYLLIMLKIQKCDADWVTIKLNGFAVQANNPNKDLYSEVLYRASNESLKKYPFLRVSDTGEIRAAAFKQPPGDQVKIE